MLELHPDFETGANMQERFVEAALKVVKETDDITFTAMGVTERAIDPAVRNENTITLVGAFVKLRQSLGAELGHSSGEIAELQNRVGRLERILPELRPEEPVPFRLGLGSLCRLIVGDVQPTSHTRFAGKDLSAEEIAIAASIATVHFTKQPFLCEPCPVNTICSQRKFSPPAPEAKLPFSRRGYSQGKKIR